MDQEKLLSRYGRIRLPAGLFVNTAGSRLNPHEAYPAL
jgi:hypothetical protein